MEFEWKCPYCSYYVYKPSKSALGLARNNHMGKHRKAEYREILLDLVKRKNITNNNILRYINRFCLKYLTENREIGTPRPKRPPITEPQYQKAESLISMAWKKLRNRERLRSFSACRRRKITKGKIIKLKKVRCELCGRRRKLVLHHLIPIHMGGEHVKENLIAICKECHSSQLLHGGIWKSYAILTAVRRYKEKHKRIEILRGIFVRWRQGKKIIVRGGNLYQRYATGLHYGRVVLSTPKHVPEKHVPEIDWQGYYCKKCHTCHRSDSKIYEKHRKFSRLYLLAGGW